jgi:hypothetical protein
VEKKILSFCPFLSSVGGDDLGHCGWFSVVRLATVSSPAPMFHFTAAAAAVAEGDESDVVCRCRKLLLPYLIHVGGAPPPPPAAAPTSVLQKKY